MPEHLSVIMPVFNERYLVGECIRRVLAVRSPLTALSCSRTPTLMNCCGLPTAYRRLP